MAATQTEHYSPGSRLLLEDLIAGKLRKIEFPPFEAGVRSSAREYRSNSDEKAISFCRILVFLCKMTCNQAEVSSFVPGNLSLDPLFSYTFPESR
jgi:hypothetical protein